MNPESIKQSVEPIESSTKPSIESSNPLAVELPSDFSPEVQALETSDKPLTLKQRAIKGSLWTLVGYGSGQVMRLGSNLILTRLLFPEAFGLMALVQTFMSGLQMFSDIGVFPNIVQSKRGDDPIFLNTAWTVQIARGFALWIGSCLLAVPAAHFFNESQLMYILPVSGLTALVSGFSTTKLATANRQLKLGRLTFVDLGSSVAGLIVMITGAWLYRSVWALVVGGVIGSLIRVIAGHIFLEGQPNRFCWEKESLQSLKNFGRWIFFSTVLAFFASQGDRLVMGRLMDVKFLGIYTIALGLSGMADQVVDQISSRVLFPSYAELVRERPENLYRTLRKGRLILISVSLGCSLFFVVFGKFLIAHMYDERYTEAGWILRVLAIGLVARTLSATYGDVLLAKGKTFLMMVLLIFYTTFQFTAMVVGHHFGSTHGLIGGIHGLIIGIAATNWMAYCTDVIFYAREGLWQPEVDLPVIAVVLMMVGIVVYF
jgi:O-antigen/teichoic acid export membrane protein